MEKKAKSPEKRKRTYYVPEFKVSVEAVDASKAVSQAKKGKK